MTGHKLIALWLLTLFLETVLALGTFKTRLATDGMPANRALVYGSLWEAAHLLLLAVIIPGLFLFLTWQYLRKAPLQQWSIRRIVLAWLATAIAFYLAMMVETAAAETILPPSVSAVVPGVYGVFITVTAGTLALTLKWLQSNAFVR